MLGQRCVVSYILGLRHVIRRSVCETSHWILLIINACVRDSPNGNNGNFTNGTIGSQWYHW